MAATVAWGLAWEYTPNRAASDALLVEWDFQAATSLATYGRAEFVTKELVRHVHVPDDPHPHFFSNIGAVTVGAVV